MRSEWTCRGNSQKDARKTALRPKLSCACSTVFPRRGPTDGPGGLLRHRRLQGRLLQLLTRLVGARRVLEFGTLGGYSAILMARLLPEDGRLITLEAKPEYAEVARRSIERAGLGDRVEVRVGPALEALIGLEGEGPFDLVFIDADKVNTPNYFRWALDHARPGGLIVADNVVRDGTLAEAHNPDEAVQAQRALHEMLRDERRVSATTIQTVGVKGYDGLLIALVEDA
ncbi:MAG TPA: O-methyltransferase [Solirubrobacterales bacterium]|nr:O-methyltransferase [Solirubrobacterales bacterium]